MRAIGSCLALVVGVALAGGSGDAEDDSVVGAARIHVKAAQDARKAGRAQAALDFLLAAYALRPHHGGVAFELGTAYAAVGQVEEAAEMLRVVAAMGFAFPTDDREELRVCRAHPACGEAMAAIAGNRKPKATGAVAFTFVGPGLVPEGLAYDRGSDCPREQRAATADPEGRSVAPSRTFADRGAGLWAALGLAVDEPRRRLWVATAALPEMVEAIPADKGRSALVALDLASGQVVARHELPSDRPHVLGDVIVTPAGDVLTTDSASPAIYRLPAGGAALETVAAGEPFVSLQGLALAEGGGRLYVADYAKGIFAVDLASRRVRLLEAPRTAAILGIDGLSRAGDALLAIQNGTDLPRLLRLAVEGDRITSVEVVDSIHRWPRSHAGGGGGGSVSLASETASGMRRVRAGRWIRA